MDEGKASHELKLVELHVESIHLAVCRVVVLDHSVQRVRKILQHQIEPGATVRRGALVAEECTVQSHDVRVPVQLLQNLDLPILLLHTDRLYGYRLPGFENLRLVHHAEGSFAQHALQVYVRVCSSGGSSSAFRFREFAEGVAMLALEPQPVFNGHNCGYEDDTSLWPVEFYEDPEGYYHLHGRDKLALSVHKQVLPLYGFTADKHGVQEMLQLCAKYLSDPEFAHLFDSVNAKLGMSPSACQRFRQLIAGYEPLPTGKARS
eukprot:CAMPEP_0181457928 /NCGR_PEP_ID=MMETSP1110-20121109/32040_1 /TAXON_ID=174948 /ORGANISM="Symbiodinium sp., Strain CCMP421" /LENGTH=261 /DNA_ID=CAMNT_0023582387 /DNA_START=551 /DNA_END=1337 /DNA_ORIENTATION=-